MDSLADQSVRVFRVPINSGGYDSGGAYWGIGAPLYCATDQEEYTRYIRAQCREEAICALRLPNRVLIKGIPNNPADQPAPAPAVPQGRVEIRRAGRGFDVYAVDSSGKVIDSYTNIAFLGNARAVGKRFAEEYSFPVCEKAGLDRYESDGWQETVYRMND